MCLNVNFLQLKNVEGLVKSSNDNNSIINSRKTHQALSFMNHNSARDISLVNGTAKNLPCTDNCVDRVIAL